MSLIRRRHIARAQRARASLALLERRFHQRYLSFKREGHAYTAKAWKRAWLDLKRELARQHIEPMRDGEPYDQYLQRTLSES